MNKKITLSVVLIAIIALALTTWFVHNQISDLQNKINIARDVKITGFLWIGGFHPVGGLTLAHPVNVTVKNMGVNDVSGLNLTVKLLYIDTGAEVGLGYVRQIDIIHAGEILEFSGEIWAAIDSFSKDSAVCVVTLTLGDIVLDKWTRSLEKVY